MQVWLLSCHSVSPPWVWTLFVRAPSGLHVLCVFLVLPCLHVCVLFTFVLVHAYASSTTRNQMTTCAYTGPRHARRTTAEQPTGQLNGPPRDKARGSPRDNRGMTRGTATGQPQWQPQERVLGPAAVRLKSRVPPTPGSTAKNLRCHVVDGRWNAGVAARMYQEGLAPALRKAYPKQRSFLILEDNHLTGYKAKLSIEAKARLRLSIRRPPGGGAPRGAAGPPDPRLRGGGRWGRRAGAGRRQAKEKVKCLKFPKRSPDLNPLDYGFWSMINTR